MPEEKLQIVIDMERCQLLAGNLYAGEGFLIPEDINVPKMLLELLAIIAKYDKKDDRDFLIYHVGEILYPMTFEGQHVISAFIDRATNSRKRPKQS
jgi:hypothetical protein